MHIEPKWLRRKAGVSVFVVCLSVLGACGGSESEVSKGSENEKQGKKVLSETAESWITWRYFQSRTMFYFTHLQSWRCGIDRAKWGLDPNKLTREFPIAECDEDNPSAVPSEARTYIYTDDIGNGSSNGDTSDDGSSGSDSFIGLSEDSGNEDAGGKNEEAPTIDRIFVQITYFDGSKSDVMEFDAPESALGPE